MIIRGSIGFSGGKDSTVVCHLVFEHLLSLPRSDRRRPVHIVTNDTLVESPLVIAHIEAATNEIRRAAEVFGLPIYVQVTRPDDDHTFWVSLIGRGYPSPNRNFRWCTDRMEDSADKSLHTTAGRHRRTGHFTSRRKTRRKRDASRQRSTLRQRTQAKPPQRLGRLHGFSADRRDDDRRHLGISGCRIRPPWGGSHSSLIALYRNASGRGMPRGDAKI